MDAGMGATTRGGMKGGTSNNQINGIASTAFIDINYETPINKQQQQQHFPPHPQQMNYPPIPPQPQLQQQQNMYMGYPPNINNNNNQMFMNPQMNMSVNSGFIPQQQQQQQQQMMYMNPSSSLLSISQPNNKQRSKQRRNSNSSMNTMSVNKFMKKHWNKIGGGGDDDDDDNDGGDDPKVEIDQVNNEISFEDLQHIRGDRPGFGLTDSTPYIPTLKVTTNSNNSKITGEQYRKIQMAQKKAMALNFARQNKQNNQNQNMMNQSMMNQSMMNQSMMNQSMMNQSMMNPPRSMSLQSYNSNGYSPFYSNQMMQQQQIPPNGMMPPMNNQPFQQYPPLPQTQQQQIPSNGMIPPINNNPYNNPNMSNPQFNPRSMSLQSESVMRQRNFSNNSYTLPKQQQQQQNQSNQIQPNNEIKPTAPNLNIDTTLDNKKIKKVNKIDFSPITADDKNGINGITEQLKENKIVEEIDRPYNDQSLIKHDILPILPANDSKIDNNIKRDNKHQNSRSVTDSVVSFDSITQRDQKNKQSKIYHLRNNSSQKTIFYSASEFVNNSQNDINNKNIKKDDNIDDSKNSVEMKKQLSTHKEENENSVIDEEEPIPKEPIPKEPINIEEINESLDKLVTNNSPIVNKNVFANNYGSYGDDIRESTISYQSSENTKPLNLSSDSNNNTNNDDDNDDTTTTNHNDIIETSSPTSKSNDELTNKSNRETLNSLSPAKTEDSKTNYVDMTISLKSKSKETSPSKSSVNSKNEVSTQNDTEFLRKKFSPPNSAIGLLSESSLILKSSPSKIRSIDSEPRTPISLNSSNRTSFFTPEQCGLLNNNSQLLQELELVTTELASSVSREIELEDDLRKSLRFNSKDDLSIKNGNTKNNNINSEGLADDTITDENVFREKESKTRTASQYAGTISLLTKQLNEERKKRFLVEEMLLQLQQTSNTSDLEIELLEQKSKVVELRDEISNINENVKLYQIEKDLLNDENNSLKLKIQELENKYGNLENEIVPKLRNQVEMLEELLHTSKNI